MSPDSPVPHPIEHWSRGAAIEPFHTSRIARQVGERIRQGRAVIPMHFGQPTVGAPPAALAAATRVLAGNPTGYFESRELIERIARHYADTYGLVIDPARIVLTAGASAALVAIYSALFDAGDRIAIVRPGYPAYRNALLALGREPVEIDVDPTEGYRLSAAMLAAVPGPLHGLVIASPANPTGAMLDRVALTALAQACRARGTLLVSDEIYHGITYGERAVCALEVDPAAIVINSFSKLFRMPGWRLGWLVVPPSLVQRVSACVDNFFLTAPTLSQHAALAAFDDAEDLLQSVVGYRQNRDWLHAALCRAGVPVRVLPEGAFYLYADVGHLTRDAFTFCERLLAETGVSSAPGIDFDPVHGHTTMRFSFALRPSEVERAVEVLVPWFKRQAPLEAR